MGMPSFKAERRGHDCGVSYILLSQMKKYAFRGYPDFIVHEEDVGAGRILVATGEIQSTQNPDVQNAVGCLLKNLDPNRPILCLKVSVTVSQVKVPFLISLIFCEIIAIYF